MLSFVAAEKHAKTVKTLVESPDPQLVAAAKDSASGLASSLLQCIEDRKAIIEAVHDFLDEMKSDCVGVPRREKLMRNLGLLTGWEDV